MSAPSSSQDLRVLAAKVAAEANLKDLRLQSSHTEVIQLPTPGAELNVDLNIELTTKGSDQNEIIALMARFDVTISESPAELDKTVAKISCTFASAFAMQEPRTWSDEELEAFANTTGIFAIYPYAREFVSDATSRLGLPTLTLDFLKL